MSERSSSQSLAQRARQEEERPAAHRFKVGETYANRRGKYEVLDIAPPKMTIRYNDGEVVTADIAILARIWDNMQLPPEQEETAPRTRAATRRPPAQPRAAKTTRRPSDDD